MQTEQLMLYTKEEWVVKPTLRLLWYQQHSQPAIHSQVIGCLEVQQQSQ